MPLRIRRLHSWPGGKPAHENQPVTHGQSTAGETLVKQFEMEHDDAV
jgi:hypothetical protein